MKDLVNNAREIALQALQGVVRSDGSPFIGHADAVARIVDDELGLPAECVAAVYLHEATRTNQMDLKGFPADVLTMVDGLNKISGIKPKDTRLEAENYKKLIVQYSTDPRVAVIKIADRLEIMRSLGIFPKSAREQKILETLMLYIPLAHQLGLYNIKRELEDIYFRYADPEQYRAITNKLKATEPDRERLMTEFIEPLKQKLSDEGIKYKLKIRTKTAYSIYRKMQVQKVPFEGVFDVFAIRFIIDCEQDHTKELELCWKVFGYVPNYSNFGGGANGGPVFATNAGATNGLYASQSNGYSFGVGQDAADRVAGSYNDNGASGAGGGWYGGYAIQTTNTSGLAGPGGGGSGFVYTPTATLPSGYDIDPAYQLSGAYMCANKSEQASIKILEMVSEDLLEAGDIIKFVASGSMSSLTLNPGVYTLKCKGCDGSVRYDMNDSPRGGYSEGTLTLAEPTEIRAFVGGTGIGDNLVSNDYVRETFPDIGANGGGMPIKLGGGFTGHSGGAGSGATDFRIAISSGQDILPDGYTQLKYFRVNGSQYLDTKYIPTFEDNVYIECCPYKDGVNWTSIGGAGIDQANHDLSFWTRYNSTIALHRGGGSYTEPGYTQTIGKKFTIYNIVNVLYVDGVQYGSVPDATTLNCTRSFYLGCNHFSSNTSYNSTFQYHRFYIHNNDSLVVDMYPCIELATGRVGMYDIIREKFYPGTGGLIAGPTVNTSASEYTRVIVAGGAGGCGGAVGGTGGGTTGGNPQGSSGTNAGPGTQTESPQSSTYYIINGGFGYGGNSASTGDGYSSGVSGGAGGGGWYGGCGTYPSGSSDNQKGGSGGSGFVFTQNARVPQEYELSDLYYLEDAYTTPSSNNTLIGLAEASIEVVDISGSYILCRDAEGIKGFNSETQQWEYIADELTPELFEEYGSFTFKTDAGLLDEYDILVNEADDIASLRMDVVPAEQHVIYETVTPMTVDRLDFDTDYDRNLFDVNVDVTRQPRGTATKIIIDVGINKRDVTSKRAKVYSGIMMSK